MARDRQVTEPDITNAEIVDLDGDIGNLPAELIFCDAPALPLRLAMTAHRIEWWRPGWITHFGRRVPAFRFDAFSAQAFAGSLGKAQEKPER